MQDKDVLTERIILDDETVPQDLFSDWTHTVLNVCSSPTEYRPGSTLKASKTQTVLDLVFVNIPTYSLGSDDSPTYFWKKIQAGTSDDIVRQVQTNISKFYRVSDLQVCVYLNIAASDITKSVDAINQQPDLRNCLHFFADNSRISINGADPSDLFINSIPCASIIQQTYECGIHIIDCDYAGRLFDKYNEILYDQYVYRGDSNDFFAFFSCSPNEKMPRSSDLPNDLFSSCIMSPAKMAILWHSCHYFCFSSGPLQILSIEELNNVDESLIQSVYQFLRCSIEAMVCRKLSPPNFVQLFRNDHFVAEAVMGYVLSQKVLDFFDVHPMSIPQIPDFRKDPEWHYIELFLDSVMLSIRDPSAGDPRVDFMKYNITTMNLLLDSDADIQYFYPYVSALHMILTAPEYAHDGCRFFSHFMDRGLTAVSVGWLFPLIDPLVDLFKNDPTDPYLLICIVKSFCYAPSARDNFSFLDSSYIYEKILPMIENSNIALLSLVFVTFYVKNHPINIKKVLETNYREYIRKAFQYDNPDIKAWALLLLSSIGFSLADLNDKRMAFERTNNVEIILKNLNDKSPSVRVAANYSLIPYIGDNYDIEILQQICKGTNDMNPNVRLIVLDVLHYFFTIYNSKSNQSTIFSYLFQYSNSLVSDPYPVVNELSKKLKRLLTERSPNAEMPPDSFVFEYFAQTILGPISHIAENPKLSIEEPKLTKSETTYRSYLTISNINMKRTTTFEIENSQVSSNLAWTSQEEIVYGNSLGQISFLKSPVLTKPQTLKLSSVYLTHVDVMSTHNFDLVLVSDALGRVFTMQKRDNEIKMVTAFSTIPNLNKPSNFYFETTQYDQKMLYILKDESDIVSTFDLVSEKRLYPITPNSGQLVSAHFLKRHHDLIMICSNQFEIHDIREKGKTPLLMTPQKPLYDAYSNECDAYQYYLCHNDFSVSLCDIRNPMPLRTMSSSFHDGNPLSFSAHPSSSLIGVGSSKGLSLMNFENKSLYDVNTQISTLFTGNKMKPVTQILFHPQKNSFITLQDGNSIHLYTESQ